MCERSREQVRSTNGTCVVFNRTPACYPTYVGAFGEDLARSDWVAGMRTAVDHTVRDPWVDDARGWGAAVTTVSGMLEERARQVLAGLNYR